MDRGVTVNDRYSVGFIAKERASAKMLFFVYIDNCLLYTSDAADDLLTV